MSSAERDQTTARRTAALLVLMGLVGAGTALAVGVGGGAGSEPEGPGDELAIERGADPTEEAGDPADAPGALLPAGSWRSLPEAPITARDEHAVAWTGDELLVWGGRDGEGWRGDGAAFDPDTATWRPLPEAPVTATPRTRWVWTGEELAVLLAGGGEAAYDPAADEWRALPAPPEDDWRAAAALGGEVALVSDRSAVTLRAGGEWEPIAPPPVTEVRTAAATGGRLVVLGARYSSTATVAYDPVDERWSHPEAADLARDGSPTATGDPGGHRMLVIRRAHVRRTTQAALEWTAGEGWRRLPRVASSLSRASPELIAAARGTVAWAPYEPAGSMFLAEGADAWAPLASPPDEVAGGARAVWTGEELMVWGGASATGGAWRPQRGIGLPPPDAPRLAGEWRTLPAPPFELREPSLTWTGAHLLVWGGETPAGERAPHGARYEPEEGSWEPLPQAPVAGRADHAAVWTGEELVVWGGRGEEGWVADGAAYDPKADAWRGLPEAPLPSRGPPVAEWYASEAEVVVASGSPPEVAAYAPGTGAWRSLPAPPSGAGAPLGLVAGPRGLLMATDRGAWLLSGESGEAWEPRGAHGLGDSTMLGSGAGDLVGLGSGRLARYDGLTGRWLGAAAPWGDVDAQPVAWTGRHLYVWGAARVGDSRLGRRTAAAYDPTSDVWNALPDPPPAVAVSGPAVWTGEEVVWWQPRGEPVTFAPREP